MTQKAKRLTAKKLSAALQLEAYAGRKGMKSAILEK